MKFILTLACLGVFIGGYFVFNREPRKPSADETVQAGAAAPDLSQDQKVALEMAKFLEKDGAKILGQGTDQKPAPEEPAKPAKTFDELSREHREVEDAYSRYANAFGSDPESRSLHEITALGAVKEGADLNDLIEGAQGAYAKLYEKPVDGIRSARDALKAIPETAVSERMTLIQIIERVSERSPEARSLAREVLTDAATAKDGVSANESAVRGEALAALKRFETDASGRQPAADEIEKNIDDQQALEWARRQSQNTGGPNVESK